MAAAQEKLADSKEALGKLVPELRRVISNGRLGDPDRKVRILQGVEQAENLVLSSIPADQQTPEIRDQFLTVLYQRIGLSLSNEESGKVVLGIRGKRDELGKLPNSEERITREANLKSFTQGQAERLKYAFNKRGFSLEDTAKLVKVAIFRSGYSEVEAGEMWEAMNEGAKPETETAPAESAAVAPVETATASDLADADLTVLPPESFSGAPSVQPQGEVQPESGQEVRPATLTEEDKDRLVVLTEKAERGEILLDEEIIFLGRNIPLEGQLEGQPKNQWVTAERKSLGNKNENNWTLRDLEVAEQLGFIGDGKILGTQNAQALRDKFTKKVQEQQNINQPVPVVVESQPAQAPPSTEPVQPTPEQKNRLQTFLEKIKNNTDEIIEAIKKDPKSAAMIFGLGIIGGGAKSVVIGAATGTAMAAVTLANLPALVVLGTGIGVGVGAARLAMYLEEKWFGERLQKQFLKVALNAEGQDINANVESLSAELKSKIEHDKNGYLKLFCLTQTVTTAVGTIGTTKVFGNLTKDLYGSTKEWIDNLDLGSKSKPIGEIPKGEQMGPATTSGSPAAPESQANLPPVVKAAEETVKPTGSTTFMPDVHNQAVEQVVKPIIEGSGNQAAQGAVEVAKKATEAVSEKIYTVLPGDNFSSLVQELSGGADPYGKAFVKFFMDNAELFTNKPGPYGEAAKALFKYLSEHPNEIPRGATRVLYDMFMKATGLINPGDVIKFTV